MKTNSSRYFFFVCTDMPITCRTVFRMRLGGPGEHVVHPGMGTVSTYVTEENRPHSWRRLILKGTQWRRRIR